MSHSGNKFHIFLSVTDTLRSDGDDFDEGSSIFLVFLVLRWKIKYRFLSFLRELKFPVVLENPTLYR